MYGNLFRNMEWKFLKKVYTGEMDFLNYIDENYEYEAICKWFQKG